MSSISNINANDQIKLFGLAHENFSNNTRSKINNDKNPVILNAKEIANIKLIASKTDIPYLEVSFKKKGRAPRNFTVVSDQFDNLAKYILSRPVTAIKEGSPKKKK